MLPLMLVPRNGTVTLRSGRSSALLSTSGAPHHGNGPLPQLCPSPWILTLLAALQDLPATASLIANLDFPAVPRRGIRGNQITELFTLFVQLMG